VVLPECNHALKQIRATQNRAFLDCGGPNYDVTASSRCIAVAAEAEFFTGQSVATGRLVDYHVNPFELEPIFGRRQVNFQHARIRGNAELMQPRIGSRSIALDPNGHLKV